MKRVTLGLCALAVAAVLCQAGSAPRNEPAHLGAELGPAYDALFNDLDLVKKGQLGLARDPLYSTHLRRDGLNPRQTRVQDLVDKVEKQGYVLEEGLFDAEPHVKYTANIPGKTPEERTRNFNRIRSTLPTTRVSMWTAVHMERGQRTLFQPRMHSSDTNNPELDSFGNLAYDRAKSKIVVMTRDGYTIVLAPIRYEHKHCLSCHKSAKLNATAAVMAFALRKSG